MNKLVVIFLFAFNLLASSQEVDVVGDIKYSFNTTGKTATVLPNSYAKFDIVIPSTVTYKEVSYTVTAIADNAFYFRTQLKTISLPNTIAVFGNSSFYYCTSLQSIDLSGTSLSSINKDMFLGCNNLTSVKLPNTITAIKESAFKNCTKLSEINFPESLQEIDKFAFEFCSGLKEIVLPNTLKTMGHGVFYNCTQLKTFVANTIETLGSFSFIGCTSLQSVDLSGSSLSIIKNQMFQDCTSLTSVVLPNSIETIDDSAFKGCSSLSSVQLSNALTTIKRYAFEKCSSLSILDLPESIQTIEREAFSDCSSLTDIDLHNSLTTMESGAFYNCVNLSSVKLSNSLTVLESSVFNNCAKLSSVTLPNSLTVIEGGAFENCAKLSSVTLPNSLTVLGGSAFAGCSSLTAIVIPESVASIIGEFFQGCTNLTYIEVVEGNSFFSSVDGVLYNKHQSSLIRCPSQKASMNIPGTVMSFYDFAFEGCVNLQDMVIPKSVKYLSRGLFSGCRSLTNVQILPDVIGSVWRDAFAGCSIESIAFNDVDYFDSDVFSDCVIKEISFNNLGYIDKNAFDGCDDIVITIHNPVVFVTEPPKPLFGAGSYEYNFRTNSSAFVTYQVRNLPSWLSCSSSDTYYYDKGETISGVIPSDATGVYEYEIDACRGSVCVTQKVQINVSEETGCISNQEIDDINYSFRSDGTATIIGKNNFNINPNERYKGDFVIPSTVNCGERTYEVTTIGSDAFEFCEDLTSVSMPNSITEIQGAAFYRCDNLTSVEFSASLTDLQVQTFSECGFSCFVVPETIVTMNGGVSRWSDKLTSFVIGSNVRDIYGYILLEDCPNLSEVICMAPEPPSVGFGFDPSVPIYVPDAIIGAYLADNVWGDPMWNLRPLSERTSTEFTTTPPSEELSRGDIYRYQFAIKHPDCTNIKVTHPDWLQYDANTQTFSGTVPADASGSYVCRVDAVYGPVTTSQEIPLIVLGGEGCTGSQEINGINYLLSSDGTATVISKDTYSGDIVIPPTVICNAKAYTVTKIGDRAFNSAPITSVVIPSTVKTIEEYAFQYCDLSHVDIPSSVELIGREAFGHNPRLDNLLLGSSVADLPAWVFEECGFRCYALPESVKTMDGGAFGYNKSLTTFTIGSHVTDIYGYMLLEGCANLTEVICLAPVPPGIIGFGFDLSVPIYVPDENYNAYMAHDVWRERNLRPLSERTTTEFTTTPPSGELLIGVSYHYRFAIQHPECTTFNVRNLPAWLSYDPATQTIQGKAPSGSEGSYTYYIDAINGSVTSTQVVTLVVGQVCKMANEIKVLKQLRDINGGITTSGWDLSDTPDVSTWTGVTVDNKCQVTAIRLPNDGLSGTLPSALCTLPYLTSVDFSGNQLGAYPDCLCGKLGLTPQVKLSSDGMKPVCERGTVRLTARVTPAGPYTYRWYAPSGALLKQGFDASYDVINMSQASLGSYRVVVLPADGSCQGTSDFALTNADLYPTPQVTILDLSPSSCTDTKDGAALVKIAGADKIYKFDLRNPFDIVYSSIEASVDKPTPITNLWPGTYMLMGKTQAGCPYEGHFRIEPGRTVIDSLLIYQLPCTVKLGESLTASFQLGVANKRASQELYKYRIYNLSTSSTSYSGVGKYNMILHVDFPYVHGQQYEIQISDVICNQVLSRPLKFVVANSNIPESEVNVLLELRAANGGKLTQMWDPVANPNVCQWPGIKTDGNHIVGIYLPNDGLTGTLPDALCSLLYLKHIDFSGNHLTSPFPLCLCSKFDLSPMVSLWRQDGQICPGGTIRLEANVTEKNQLDPKLNCIYRWFTPGGKLLREGAEPYCDVMNVQASSLGMYRVEVFAQEGGCTGYGNYALTADVFYPLPTINVSKIEATTCSSASDGSAQIGVSGTDRSYTFDIIRNDGAIVASVNKQYPGSTYRCQNLSRGTYFIKGITANGCPYVQSFAIANGGPIFSNVCTSTLPMGLLPGKTVQANVTFTVNRLRKISTSYQYEIVNRVTGGYVSGGTGYYAKPVERTLIYEQGQNYVIRLRDGYACSEAETTYPLTFNPLNPSFSMGGTFTRCFEGQELDIKGRVNYTVSGCSPKPSPTYKEVPLMNPALSNTPVFYAHVNSSGELDLSSADLPAGTYEYVIEMTDPYYGNWQHIGGFTIDDTDLLKIDVETWPATCPGVDDGRALARVTGGVPPYRYQWRNASGKVVSVTSSAVGLAPGTGYSLMVYDSRDCELDKPVKTFDIAAAPDWGELSVQLPDVSSADCSVKATLSEAIPGNVYSFNWIQIKYRRAIRFEGTGADMRGVRDDKASAMENSVWNQDVPVEAGASQAISESDYNTVKPGSEYYLVVRDQNGCEYHSLTEGYLLNGSTVQKPFALVQHDVEREYNLVFAWKTRTRPADPQIPPKKHGDHVAKMAAAQMANKLKDKAAECARITGEAAKGDFVRLCLTRENLKDELSIGYRSGGYHYTLYYYDRMGNLAKTVPPAGVNLCVGDVASWTGHSMVTSYSYNSLRQLVLQKTPDAGETRFLYNHAGQLRFSQNAQQSMDKTFSYTKYDNLGRIGEVGQGNFGDASLGFAGWDALAAAVPAMFETEQALPLADRFPGSNLTTPAVSQRTVTYYSQASAVSCYGRMQRYLLNRVSHTVHENVGGAKVTTYYSYDPHGNVEWLVQELPDLGRRTISYAYDLISGKVTRVAYNEGEADEFYHQYEYDEDNRIRLAQTSTNGVVWENDATYNYYKHGPLKRMELGKDRVQGLDYVYTLQGWLKGINYPTLWPSVDPGKDGIDADGAARDFFGMILSYYAGDYKNSTSLFDPAVSRPFGVATELLPEAGRDLYNGNIAAWTHITPKISMTGTMTFGRVLGQQFTYDKLNRIKQSRFSLFSSISWAPMGSQYGSSYNYDGNGNLTTLSRYNDNNNQQMDDLAYHYTPGTNRLDHVTDAVRDGMANDDVDNQAAGNYRYDAIGNLTGDVKEGIANIAWTVYGKVSRIEKSNGTTVSFLYDAMGNRIAKTVKLMPGGLTTTTYYVRDAQGSVMAVYNGAEERAQGGRTGKDYVIGLMEQPIYGSSRLGMRLGGGLEVKRINRPLRGVPTEVKTNIAASPLLTADVTNQGTLWRYSAAGLTAGIQAQTTDSYRLCFTVDDAVTGPERVYSLTYGGERLWASHAGQTGTYGMALAANATQPTALSLALEPISLSRYDSRPIAHKQYELTDHLGNVRVVVSSALKMDINGTLMPQLVAANNYYPFGMTIASLGYSGEKYRYGFNGKEKDDKGEWGMTHYDYGFRIYNPAIAKFLSVDPLTATYPWYTPYQFAGNKPIRFIDLDGLEETVSGSDYKPFEIFSLKSLISDLFANGLLATNDEEKNREILQKQKRASQTIVGMTKVINTLSASIAMLPVEYFVGSYALLGGSVGSLAFKLNEKIMFDLTSDVGNQIITNYLYNGHDLLEAWNSVDLANAGFKGVLSSLDLKGNKQLVGKAVAEAFKTFIDLDAGTFKPEIKDLDNKAISELILRETFAFLNKGKTNEEKAGDDLVRKNMQKVLKPYVEMLVDSVNPPKKETK